MGGNCVRLVTSYLNGINLIILLLLRSTDHETIFIELKQICLEILLYGWKKNNFWRLKRGNLSFLKIAEKLSK